MAVRPSTYGKGWAAIVRYPETGECREKYARTKWGAKRKARRMWREEINSPARVSEQERGNE